MHRTLRRTTCGLIAIVAMALAITAASANNLSTSTRNIRLTWAELEFEVNETAFARCPVTLEGSFHESTVRKVSDTLIGYITRAAVGFCNSGQATALQASLPWHIRYMGFTGRLPRIETITWLIVGAAFRAEHLGFFCLADTTESFPADLIARINEAGGVASVTPDSSLSIPLVSSGGFGCPSAQGQFRSNTGSLMALGTTESVRIRLI